MKESYADGVDFKVIEKHLDYLTSGYGGGNKRYKGDIFEVLSKYYLKNHPDWKSKFREVWLWSERPQRFKWGGIDKGVDLIAETPEGFVWAIQCKCYKTTGSVNHGDISSFLSESNRPEVYMRLLMTTTDRIGKNATETIVNQQKPVQVLKREHFNQPFNPAKPFRWPREITVRGTRVSFVTHLPKPVANVPKKLEASTPLSQNRHVNQRNPTVREYLLGCLAVVVCFFGIMTAITLLEPGFDRQESKLKPYPITSTKRSEVIRPDSYQSLAQMNAVKSLDGTVRFSKKHPLIGISKSATEISINNVVTGKTVSVKTSKTPILTFAWTADGKLVTKEASDADTVKMRLAVKGDVALIPVASSQSELVRVFPDLELIGLIDDELAGINSFSVNADATKIVCVQSDGNVSLWKKDETEKFSLWQMCIDPSSKVADAVLFSSDKVVVGWQSGDLAIYQSASELPIRIIDGIEEGLTVVSVSPDNSVLVAGYASGLLAIYSLTGPDESRLIRNEVIKPVSEIVFSDDSEAFAVVDDHGKVVTFGTSLMQQSARRLTDELFRKVVDELTKP